MILINLLPPELRKRKSDFQFNPMLAGALAGAVVCLAMLGAFLWLRSELARSTELLIAKNAELDDKIAKAAVVTARKALIAEFEKKKADLFSLIGQKVYWAKTLDDFNKQIIGEWSLSGFKVSVGDLVVSQIASEKRAGGPEEVRSTFRWRYKIVGDVEQRSGDYLNSFFKTIEKGNLWKEGFVGKPEEGYDGDRPRWNEKLKKLVVEGALNWQRVKVIESKKSGAKTPEGN